MAVALRDGRPVVVPEDSRIKLLPDAAEYFRVRGEQIDGEIQVSAEALGLVPAAGAHPLRAVYILDRRREALEPEIVRRSGLEAFVKLLPHVDSVELAPPALRARVFEACMRLLHSIPVAELRFSGEMDALPRVGDILLEDMRACASSGR